MSQNEFCDLCNNSCPINALNCGRGIAAYGNGVEGEDQDGSSHVDVEHRGHGGHGEHGRGGHGGYGRGGHGGRRGHGYDCGRDECGLHGEHGAASEAQGSAKPASMATDSNNALVKLLVEAGNAACHKSARIREAGKDDAIMFDVLEADDRQLLEQLLEKLTAAWREAHAKHAKEVSSGK